MRSWELTTVLPIYRRPRANEFFRPLPTHTPPRKVSSGLFWQNSNAPRGFWDVIFVGRRKSWPVLAAWCGATWRGTRKPGRSSCFEWLFHWTGNWENRSVRISQSRMTEEKLDWWFTTGWCEEIENEGHLWSLPKMEKNQYGITTMKRERERERERCFEWCTAVDVVKFDYFGPGLSGRRRLIFQTAWAARTVADYEDNFDSLWAVRQQKDGRGRPRKKIGEGEQQGAGRFWFIMVNVPKCYCPLFMWSEAIVFVILMHFWQYLVPPWSHCPVRCVIAVLYFCAFWTIKDR